MLASSGEITDPCPVPLSLTVTTPPSMTPALSHFWIRRMMRRSPIRCSRKRISHSWLISSKEAATHYPSPRSSRLYNDHPAASRVRGSEAGRDQHYYATRRAARPRRPAKRQPIPHSGGMDRLERSKGLRYIVE